MDEQTITPELLRQLYLEDLKREVWYNGVKRPRVRHPQQYENIPIMEQGDISGYENIWFISDTHFGHSNVIKYSGRPFVNANDMDTQLIDNYNNNVGQNDLTIWGGDVAFMGTTKTNAILDQLNGDKILVVGNHDMDNKKVKKMNFKETHLTYVLAPNIVITHYPLTVCPPNVFNVHGHVHNVSVASIQHVNICVEITDYAPIHMSRLQRILDIRTTSIDTVKKSSNEPIIIR